MIEKLLRWLLPDIYRHLETIEALSRELLHCQPVRAKGLMGGKDFPAEKQVSDRSFPIGVKR